MNKLGVLSSLEEVVPVGVGSRTFQTFLCDACGRETITHEGSTVDGFYIEVLQVQGGNQIGTDNVYACSIVCVERAIKGALHREALPEEEKITATQELWLKGQRFASYPGIPILDATDETTIIGTAHEIANYKPPERSGASKREPQDPLAPDWEPEFRPRTTQ